MACRCARVAAALLAVSLVPLRTSNAAPQDDDNKPLVEVTGTVVVEDGKGGTVDDESGTIVLGVHEGSSWGPHHAFVIEGQWKAKVPAGSQLSFEAFKLDGGIAYWVIDGEKGPKVGRERFSDEGPRGRGIPIPKDGRIAVRARYVPPVRVHAVDATSGAELEHVAAVRDVYYYEEHSMTSDPHALGKQQIYPTAWQKSEMRVRDAPSPIELAYDTEETFPSWEENLWVHAPGYCWAGIAVDYRVGGETTVKLVRGGTLAVKVESGPLPKETKVVLRRDQGATRTASAVEAAKDGDDESGEKESDDDPDARPAVTGHIDLDDVSSFFSDSGSVRNCAEWPYWPGQPVTFDALPFGDYHVSLEIGGRFRGKRQEFATADVALKEGASATTTLKVANAPKIPDPVALRGSIRIDAAWGDVPFEVELRPEEISPMLTQERLDFDRRSLARDPDDATVWKLPDVKVAPGTYQLSIRAFGIERTLAILRATRPIAIEVGAPIDATVRFVDAKTQAPIAVTEPTWSLLDPSTPLGDSFGDIHFGHLFHEGEEPKKADHYTLRVPAGRLSLGVDAEDYHMSSPLVAEISAEEHDVTITLRHDTGVRVRVRIDGKPVEYDEAMKEARDERSKNEYFGFWPRVRPRGSKDEDESSMRGFGSSRDGRYVTVEHAGDYTVSLPPLPAFEPTAPQDVTVADQELTEVVFDLVRKKK